MTIRIAAIAALMLIAPASACAETGIASIYSGGTTASGERMNASALTAAHPTLPFDTIVEVTNIKNNRAVVVRINDRGPYISGRVIDLTPASAAAIGISRRQGLAHVRLLVRGHQKVSGKTPKRSGHPPDRVHRLRR